MTTTSGTVIGGVKTTTDIIGLTNGGTIGTTDGSIPGGTSTTPGGIGTNMDGDIPGTTPGIGDPIIIPGEEVIK
jgi:hypothetical protein